MLFPVPGPSGTTAWTAAFWTTTGDPTGMSSPLGRAAVLVGLLAALTLTVRWWWSNRRR
jgi:hypothetical protein